MSKEFDKLISIIENKSVDEIISEVKSYDADCDGCPFREFCSLNLPTGKDKNK